MSRRPTAQMAPGPSIPRISGSAPGALDSTQMERLLRVPGARLTFAVFDPRVAIAQDMPDMRKLSIKEELYRPKRVVIETFPTGESFWRFVPSARKAEGVVDEGTWPRHIELCGQIVECTQDQWDIYKLDPLYECSVRMPPLLSTISRITTRPHAAHSSPAGKRRITSVSPDPDVNTPPQSRKQRMNSEEVNLEDEDEDEDEEEDEVEDMIIDDRNLGTRSSRGPSRRTKMLKEQILRQRVERREKIAKRAERLADKNESMFTFTDVSNDTSNSFPVNLQGKRKVNSLFDSLRSPDDTAFGGTNGDDTPRNGAYYAPSTQYKRTRTVSPSAAKRELESKRLEREKQKRDRREKELHARREERHHRFMQDMLADIQESALGANEEKMTSECEQQHESEDQDSHLPNDKGELEEAQRLAEIEESRRKLAELEKDRPIWEEMARIRREQEIAEENERCARAEAKKRAEALKAEQAKREKAEKQAAELRRHEALMREQEAHARREKERHQRQKRWALGPWTTQRALEKYKVLCETFDNTKFSETEPLTIDTIPWPTLHSPTTFSVEDVDWTAVENFFEAVRSHMRPQDYKDFVQSSHRRFHPDRWRSRSLLKSILDEAERGCIEVGQRTQLQIPQQGNRSIPVNLSTPRANTLPIQTVRPPPQRLSQQTGPLHRRVIAYFGFGRSATPLRKSQASLIWNLLWGFSQIVTITTVLVLSGTRFKSASNPRLTEWAACDRPLGIWGCLWLGRVILASILACWEFSRDRQSIRNRVPGPETSTGRAPGTGNASLGPNAIGGQTDLEMLHSDTPPEPNPLPHSHLYSRLTLLSSLLTLSWFLTAHILEYTSLNTCRHSSPHLWWLTFGILCIMYFMVLEVMLLGFMVLIVAPIIFVFWNIFLICIGRHPVQNPGMIRPEIGKLPRSVVDRIPLVMYIPAPPEATTSAEKMQMPSVPEPVHSYPPKASTIPENVGRRRFKFLRRISKAGKKANKGDQGGDGAAEKDGDDAGEEGETWEANWERGEYPFVVLEGNRATCAICLMDFEEPKRRRGAAEERSEGVGGERGDEDGDGQGTDNIREEHRAEEIRLRDAGEGAQPLRLLECGHVFHKTCLDPWLTDVSGRCPVCQRAVTLTGGGKRGRRRRGRRGDGQE
ncbi:hypothetical protein BDQ17DRAFT_1537204 [Cyathus striatus]|nr:hypothetical protein BDQ17DRAFT_1537204 [Cyathus striatus]